MLEAGMDLPKGTQAQKAQSLTSSSLIKYPSYIFL